MIWFLTFCKDGSAGKPAVPATILMSGLGHDGALLVHFVISEERLNLVLPELSIHTVYEPLYEHLSVPVSQYVRFVRFSVLLLNCLY